MDPGGPSDAQQAGEAGPAASITSPAERAFLDHLARRDAGAEESLADLCGAHPELASELAGLARRWERFAALRDRAAGDGAERPADMAGTVLALEVLDEPRRPIERYDVGDEIARGAQGIVRRTFDRNLGRFLAMKVLHGARRGAPGARIFRRFLDEARITAQLDHPSVVAVHDLGFDGEGRAFFTMKLVRGLSLLDAFEERRKGSSTWTLPRLSQALLRVAEAMSFAHDRGVIHRDLKPSNVMLGDYGEVYVMDWGLARTLGEAGPDPASEERSVTDPRPPGAPLLTLEGDVVGTPQYMPPEQAAGDLEAVGKPADVYALGAMLYHLLAGRAPYAQAGADEPRAIVQRVLAGPPAPLPAASSKVPAELAAICMKAMARQGSERYASMGDLAKDLRAWLEGRVVRAYESGALAELKKWVGRNRALSGASVAALAAVVGGLWWSARLEASGRREAEAAKERADANLADLRRLSEVMLLSELEARAGALWPAVPERVPDLRAWLGEARDLASHLAAHERMLGELRAGTAPATGLERAWWEGTLADLVERLRTFSGRTIPDVEGRLAFAETIERRSLGDHRAAWDAAVAAIGDPARCPAYGGLTLQPLLGLVPLGRDPRSGLFEFWHVQSGAQPARGPDGGLLLAEDTGIVLVLLPGGRFLMGAQRDDPSAPNFDPGAQVDESPLIEVELEPFLLSKYELTQGQWLRATGANPSRYRAGGAAVSRVHTLLHPVESVTWSECDATLKHLALILPSEAQWEYAARAGTVTPWWTGSTHASLDGAENLADASAAKSGVSWDSLAEAPELDDGFVLHGPVGSLAPNPFGLYDVLGNVYEWCRDTYEHYYLGRLPDGTAPPGEPVLVVRGGCFEVAPQNARSSFRGLGSLEFSAPLIGVRPAMALPR
jgi:formylglycine-generating enzyme required for sulfatase activity